MGVAAAYLAGYWGWSYYSKSEGLGFLHLTAPQFLAAGVTLLMLEGITVGALYAVFELVANVTQKLPATHANRALRLFLELVVLGVAATLLEIVIGYFGIVLGLLDLPNFYSTATLAIAFLFPASVYLFVLLVMSSPRVTELPGWIWRTFRQRGKRNRPEPKQLGKRTPEFHFAARAIGGVVVALLMALFFLPALSPSFGGAEPRNAYLDIERAGVSPDTLSRLVSKANLNSTALVVRTDEVVVLFDNGDTMMVRRADHATASDPLYDLSSAVVRARIWLAPK